MSLTTCADGYRVAYTHPSGTPARAVCGTSGLIITTVPGPACTVPPGRPTSSTPLVIVPKTKPSWLWRGKVWRTYLARSRSRWGSSAYCQYRAHSRVASASAMFVFLQVQAVRGVRGDEWRACPPAVVGGGVHDGGHGRFRTRFVLARDPQLVRGRLRRAHRRAGGGLACHRRGFGRPGRRTDRIGQDPGRVPGLPGPAGGHPAPRRGEEALPRAVRVTDEGPRRRRGAESAVAADRDPSGVGAPGPAGARGTGGHPLRRHPSGRAPLDGYEAAGHPDHDARITVPDAHLLGTGRAGGGGDGHRGRGARRRGHQARRPSRRLSGAPGRVVAATRPAYRSLGHGPPGRRGRAVPVAAAEGRDRPATVRQGVRPLRRGTGGGPRRAGRLPRHR